MPLLGQGCGEFDHRIDIVGGVGLQGRRQRVELGHVLAVFGSVLVGHRFDAAISLLRRSNDLVIHIGDIAGIDHLIVMGLQQAEQGVEHHHRAGVADVGQVVYGGATHVHGHGIGDQRFEHFFFGTQGVV